MPGIIKIGTTKRHPRERALTLSRSLPTRFVVEYFQKCTNANAAENAAHRRLRTFRVARSREFFAVPVNDAIVAVKIGSKTKLHKKQYDAITIERLGSLMRLNRTISKLTQEQLAQKVGVSRQTIVALEKGKENARMGVVLKVCAALDIYIGDTKGDAA